MKFQKIQAFEKHFKEAFPNHLSSIYIVICPDDNERKKILSTLTQKLTDHCDLKKSPFLTTILDHINSASLFSSKMGGVLDGLELLNKGDIELLLSYVKNPNPKGYLLLGCANTKTVTPVYKEGKKEIVILDLSSEKPWELKERLAQWAHQMIAHQKKSIAPHVLQKFLDRFPPDRMLLTQEIEKLVCYVGERGEITGNDIEAICGFLEETNLFQSARKLVWDRDSTISYSEDLSFVLPFITQVRSQLEMGLKMCTLLHRRGSEQEIKSAFPKAWPKILEQMQRGAKEWGQSYFLKGLSALFEFELAVKTSRAKPRILIPQLLSALASSSPGPGPK